MRKQGMKKSFLLLIVCLFSSIPVFADTEITEEKVNFLAQQIIEFHKTEEFSLLETVLDPSIEAIISQGEGGFGFTLTFNKIEYLDYLSKGLTSKSRKGTDVAFISFELLGEREATFTLRYRSKHLQKYVWVEARLQIVNQKVIITHIEEYN